MWTDRAKHVQTKESQELNADLICVPKTTDGAPGYYLLHHTFPVSSSCQKMHNPEPYKLIARPIEFEASSLYFVISGTYAHLWLTGMQILMDSSLSSAQAYIYPYSLGIRKHSYLFIGFLRSFFQGRDPSSALHAYITFLSYHQIYLLTEI